MGNHEYCSDCGASDFHYGRSCEEAYPEGWAKKQKELKVKQNAIDKEKARVDKLIQATLKKGKIVSRLLEIRTEEKKLNSIQSLIKDKINALRNEESALGKHCPHPKKFVSSGFMYRTCDLCFESDI